MARKIQSVRQRSKRQLVDDVAADTCVPSHEEPQDLDASGVPDGLAEERQLLVGFPTLDGAEFRLLRRL